MVNQNQKYTEPEISKEEKKYLEAVNLSEATGCIEFFEWEVKAFETSALIFEKLGDYKDAAERGRICREKAETAKLKGMEKVFHAAVEKQEKAVYKSDFGNAIKEFERVLDSEQYGEQAKEHIEACKKKIARIETISVWKKRGIAFAVLVLLVFLFRLSPAYPFTRGYILQKQGKIDAALKEYAKAESFPLTLKRVQKCYVMKGKAYLKAGKKKAAIQEFRKAEGNAEADLQVAQLEKKHLRKVKVGDQVRFGKIRWLVIKKEEKHVLLLYDKEGRKMAYNTEKNEGFRKSHIGRWLNSRFKTTVFTQAERNLLEELEPPETKEEKEHDLFYNVSLLSETEFLTYKQLLEPFTYPFWLKEAGRSGKKVNYVNRSGEIAETDGSQAVCHARPVIYVQIKKDKK